MPKRVKPLTSQDISDIRKLLPYDWRLQITNLHPDLTTRQVGEVFYLRSRNPEQTEKVFTVIALILYRLGQTKLASKCKKRIRDCKVTLIAAGV